MRLPVKSSSFICWMSAVRTSDLKTCFHKRKVHVNGRQKASRKQSLCCLLLVCDCWLFCSTCTGVLKPILADLGPHPESVASYSQLMRRRK
ncbi:uncharacterized protein LOC144200491 [Stigmatopora nigra]